MWLYFIHILCDSMQQNGNVAPESYSVLRLYTMITGPLKLIIIFWTTSPTTGRGRGPTLRTKPALQRLLQVVLTLNIQRAVPVANLSLHLTPLITT